MIGKTCKKFFDFGSCGCSSNVAGYVYMFGCIAECVKRKAYQAITCILFQETKLVFSYHIQVFSRHFRDPIRVPRISNWISAIRENYHRVPKIWEIGSLQIHTGYLRSVAARGETGREGCEISSLVEHMRLSPCLFLWLVAIPATPIVLLIKFVIFSCPYWYIENIHFSLMKPNPNRKA